MMNTAPVQVGMSVEDFVRLYDTEGPFEIIDGERIIMSPTLHGHNRHTRLLFRELDGHVIENHLGEVFFEDPFVLPDADLSNWVKGSRVPDILFISAERYDAYLAQYPDADSLPLMIVPDLVVEVVSPTDKPADVLRKVTKYQEDGVRLIWVVDAGSDSVTVYTSDPNFKLLLTGDDVLTGGDVLPGFTLSLAVLFAA